MSRNVSCGSVEAWMPPATNTVDKPAPRQAARAASTARIVSR